MSLQERFIFPRDIPGRRDPAERIPPGFEQLTITADDGSRVPAWLRLPPSSAGQRVPAVMFFHGNAELMDDVAPSSLVKGYTQMGVAVLVVEYRGYGRAWVGNSAPSESAFAADGVKFYDLLAARPEIDPQRIIFHGRSLGGGAACALARQRKPRAMILQSTFTSVRAMAAKMLVPGFLVRHPVRNDDVVAGLDAPILFLHGSHDSIIPCVHSQRLAAMAKQGKLVYQDCDHNDFPGDIEAYWREIRAFLHENGLAE